MEDQTDNNTENQPMTKTEQSQNQQHPKKVVRILLIITLAMVVVLTALSYLALLGLDHYQSNLQAYLPIHSGEIEYARIPQEYWQHRIQMIKAMGLNAVSVYVMWNHHQKAKGEFDFTSPGKDISTFLNLTLNYGLKVLLRPGPYICGEWDFGGLPARLLGAEGLQIRSTNTLYESEVKIYFSALAPLIKPYLARYGGNIILLQIENEYGYFGQNNRHILNLVQMWKDLEVQCQYYIQDPPAHWKISYWPGAHLGLSQTFSILQAVDIQLSPLLSNDTLVFGGEIYSGWFTSWGFDWGAVTINKITATVKSLLQNHRSFSLYMIFGGTNFGVTAGANGQNVFYEYLPHITSYDYDSPITEQGIATPKYSELRALMEQYYGQSKPLPQVPSQIPSIIIQSFLPKLQGFLWSNLPQPRLINSPLTFFESSQLQMYHQGIVIYETYLPEMRNYQFKAQIRDFAIVYVDQVYTTQFLRRTTDLYTFKVQCRKQSGCRLRVLVQAMGHKNFGKDQATDRKGLLYFQQKNYEQVYPWNITVLPVNDSSFSNWTNNSSTISFPTVFRYNLSLQQIGDTYFDMSLYKKGYMAVNGHLLGRYWNKGPQYRLFCPSVWLIKGINVITILQLLQSNPQAIKGYKTLRA